MADIKQAAEWMQGGATVRRKAWHPDCPSWWLEDDAQVDEEWTAIVAKEPKPNYPDLLCVGDLLADDWEIAN